MPLLPSTFSFPTQQLEALQYVERAVKFLEDLQGVPNPTGSSLFEGLWQLKFTPTWNNISNSEDVK
ncbi:hypothetical protein Patl1_36600 [Pistacia atlantica]|nr:hypothetical protein Patl1_36600 [Pistacia atlantica]